MLEIANIGTVENEPDISTDSGTVASTANRDSSFGTHGAGKCHIIGVSKITGHYWNGSNQQHECKVEQP